MPKEKKFSLEEIKVQSFITELTEVELTKVNGGSLPGVGTTSIPAFC
jgi:hypothetical protein